MAFSSCFLLVCCVSLTFEASSAIEQNDWPSPQSLVAFWPMDNSSGLQELTSNQPVKIGSPMVVPNGGPYGNGSFSVSKPNADIAIFSTNLQQNQSWTISFFYKSPGFANKNSTPPGIACFGANIFCIEYSPPNNLALWKFISQGVWDYWDLCFVKPNAWNFVAITYDFVESVLLIFGANGDMAARIADVRLEFPGQIGLHIGWNHGGPSMNYPDGMTCVTLYSNPLTPDEVKQLPLLCKYQTKPPVITTTTSETTTVTTTVPTTVVAPTCPPTVIHQRIEEPTPYQFENFERLVPPFPPEVSPPLETTGNVQEICDDFSSERTAPPVYGPPIPVQIALLVHGLVGVDTPEEFVSLNGIVFQSWNVSTCPKASSSVVLKHNREGVFVTSAEKVWVPKLRFISAYQSNIYMDGLEAGDDIICGLSKTTPEQDAINRTYSFYWTREGLFQSYCNLELSRFPFDKQECKFRFSLQRSEDIVQFTRPRLLWAKEAEQHTEWTVTGYNTSLTREFYKGYHVSVANFTLYLTRVPDFYISNLAIPVFVLSLLDVTTFFLPPDRPDRSIFTVTVVLALTVAQGDVLTHLPKKSGRILLSDYVQFSTWFTAAICVYQLLMVCIAVGVFSERKPPRYCQKHVTLLRIIDILVFILAAIFFILITIYLVANGDFQVFKQRTPDVVDTSIWL